MTGKLIKGLGGLGGAAAITTGGVFLKNHIDEVNERKRQEAERIRIIAERKEFISKANANIKAMSAGGYEGVYPNGDSEDDVWKLSWVFSVIGYNSDNVFIKDKFSKSFFRQREGVFWNVIMSSPKAYIRIDIGEKEKINRSYGEYWEKYKEGCLFWASSRSVEHAAYSDVTCMLYEKWDDYRKKSMYKAYLEIKEEKVMDLMEFYWTIWRRFKYENESELSANITDDKLMPIYKVWKEANKDDLFSNLDK